MDCSKTGALIQHLRREKNLTQRAVADILNISDKTVSKWECGLGCPDVSLLPELARLFGTPIETLLCGTALTTEPIGGNMKKSEFYVCPKCGNLLTATAPAQVCCCGQILEPLAAQKADEHHSLNLELIEDEYFVSCEHEMKKDHYISFAAFVSGDKLLIVKQYPEWGLQFRMPRLGHGKLYFYCTIHGLFYQLV